MSSARARTEIARDTPPWVAVYGSLMRGLGGLEGLGIGDRMRFVGPCVLEGELFDLGEWPGMRPGDGRVVGEIHALLDPEVIQVLDEFEDYDPANPRESLYVRKQVPLLEPEGATAWTYVYNQIPDATARIPCGDWRRWRTERA